MKALLARCVQSGPFWMVLAGLSFAVMGVFVKLGSAYFSTAELVFYRCAAGLLVIGATVLPRGQTLRVDKRSLQLHLTRSIAGFIALMLSFYAITQLPLPTAITLNYTSPLFFALLMTFYSRQLPSRAQVMSIALGFVGVVILLRPTFAGEQWLAGVLGLCAGFLASVAYLNVSELGKAGEPEWRTVFYFSLVSTIGAGVWMLLQDRAMASPDWRGWLIALGMGMAATFAQLAMTRAYRKGRSMVVVSLAYLTVVFSTLLAHWLWDEQITALSLLGMTLIVVAGIWAGATRLQRS